MMGDSLIRYTSSSFGGMLSRIEAITPCQELVSLHAENQEEAALLSRAALACLLLSDALKKPEDRVHLSYLSHALPCQVDVIAHSSGEIKGRLLHCQQKADQALLTIEKLTEDRGYSCSTVECHDLPNGIANFLSRSEEILSSLVADIKISPALKVIKAEGMLLESFPFPKQKTMENAFKTLANRGDFPRLPDFLKEIFGNEEYEETSKKIPLFACDCSKEKSLASLATLHKDDIKEFIADGGANLECPFCKRNYFLSAEELKKLL